MWEPEPVERHGLPSIFSAAPTNICTTSVVAGVRYQDAFQKLSKTRTSSKWVSVKLSGDLLLARGDSRVRDSRALSILQGSKNASVSCPGLNGDENRHCCTTLARDVKIHAFSGDAFVWHRESPWQHVLKVACCSSNRLNHTVSLAE